MTGTARDLFVTGLRNAHAMEIQARELMERQSGRLDDFPEVKRRITAHIEETHRQIERLEQCLQECGESSSTLKDTAQSIIANTMALIHSAADDEILKNTFANNAFEISKSLRTSRCWRCARKPMPSSPVSRSCFP